MALKSEENLTAKIQVDSPLYTTSEEEHVSTIQRIKSILKDYEKESSKLKENELKTEILSNELKSTLSLVNENPKKRLKELITSLDNWIHSTQLEMEITRNALQNFEDFTANDRMKKKNFIEKFHIYRESDLSTLFHTDKNIKSLYFLILTLFSWFFLWVIISDYKQTGSVIDYQFWSRTFIGYPNILKMWFAMFCYTLLIIPMVKFIEYDAKKINKIRFYYYIIYSFYQVSLYLFSFWFIFSGKINVVCSLIISAEVTRFSLKIHGYFREKILYGLKEYHLDYASFTFKPNVKVKNENQENKSVKTLINSSSASDQKSKSTKGSKIEIINSVSKEAQKNNINDKSELNQANKSQISNSQIEENILVDTKIYDFKTELNKFLYYFICPSLIYRDEYPRLSYRRPHYILAHILNFACCIAFYYILMRHICDPYFSYSTIRDYYSLPHFLFDTFRFAIPGVCFLLVGFFLILHTWMNLWSEIILHGDRRFYEDWWNCTNFEEYFRKWNMVVHEWLYYYIYNDLVRLSKGRLSRFHAKMMVFGLSVFLHEVIIWQSLGFFYPILAFFFGGPGIIFTYIKPKQQKFNIMFWTKLFLGKGLLLVFYLREFNLRYFFAENITFTHQYHEFIPRTILMFINPYKEIILNHFPAHS
jgi:sterol O-acyltransferase